MDKPRTTPKDFFLWAGAMVALYWSVVAFVGLLFDYINYALPSATSYVPVDPYQSGISYEMASLIILFPLAIILMRVIHADIRKDPSRSDIWVRRWALFLTLFVAGATMAGDLIVLLTSFLNGSDLTTAFLLKIAVVFLVAAAGFMHFLADFRGYWDSYPRRAHMVGYATGVLVLATIIAGFFIVGTPGEARKMRLDVQKVADLQSVQSQVVYYWQQKKALPMSLADLHDSISGYRAPVDPQTNQPYEYIKTGPLSFQLCADFNAAGSNNNAMEGRYPTSIAMPYAKGGMLDNWQHAAGRTCFERVIDPALYAPVPAR
jgi:hypothetical protein